MSRTVFLVVSGLLVLGGCSVPSLVELEAERSIPVTVDYSPSFKAGCIAMQVQDEANLANVADLQTFTDLANTAPPVLLKGLRRGNSGTRVRVTITAHEQTCAGKEVDRVMLAADLSGEGKKESLTATLNTPDEDGDGYVAILGDGKGGTDCDDSGPNAALRFPGNPEVCDALDNNCSGVADEGLDKNWYLDEDGDGVPRGPDFVLSCTSPSGNYIRYSAAGPFDCRDFGPDAAKMFPGNSEKCDNVDNDCDNIIDEEYFSVGATCNAECGGVTVCSGDGNSVVCSQDPGRYYYTDKDGDGQGAAGSNATLKCGTAAADPGTVSNDDDCDDVDPAARAGLFEVCDAIDNNCDGVLDNTALACGGTLKDVVNHHVGGSSHDWRAVSTGPSGYPVWIAGRGGKLAVRRTAGSKFESFSFGDGTGTPPDGSLPANSNNCGNANWTVSWVNSNGAVFLGGEGGLLAVHTGDTAAACGTGAVTIPTDNLTGMVGFEAGGVTTIYLTDSSGRLIKWVVGGNPQHTLVHDNNINVYGLHGLSENSLLVSGGSTGGSTGQEFLSYANGNPSALHTSLPNKGSGFANAVWMGRPDRACAVGDGGLAWRWDGATTWNRAESSGTTDDFSSVVMRYDAQNTSNPLNDQCYIVDKGSNGKLRRLTPFGWAKPLDLLPSNRANVPLRDIAITPTGELWIVGDDGRVFHYPEP
ncbi:putative metal-binding motif-containing protein [Myxococcus qinghaiensis]|uniref:putative metal-binding motif-containing protein n=1 Tax=Myxococcus qinghaiensis TaxID=2906758 RepID=UPI0020A7BDEA|nr:putative metal-binding motif-containing protein [Myxococcus qinghaiensis]MCP3166169.1 putative metal-binding motif-containing protein [Myxococcus qinghaiensis]